MTININYIWLTLASAYTPAYGMLVSKLPLAASCVRLLHSSGYTSGNTPLDESFYASWFYATMKKEDVRTQLFKQAVRLRLFKTEDMFFNESPYAPLERIDRQACTHYFTHLLNLPKAHEAIKIRGFDAFQQDFKTRSLFVSRQTTTGIAVDFDALTFYDIFMREGAKFRRLGYENEPEIFVHETARFIVDLDQKLIDCARSLENSFVKKEIDHEQK